jgi:hypothetical protein
MSFRSNFRGLLIAAAIAVPMFTLPIAQARAQIILSVNIAPPVLPVYAQPVCPGDGYIWTPGYWAYGDEGYFWVPGTWVLAPEPGYLWTPGYWGFEGGYYGWHRGYWGLHVGYYGGINYGFGYFGIGFVGGEWRGGHFAYNTAIYHVGPGFRHVYEDRAVIRERERDGGRYSFNGPGGIRREPVAAERIAERDRHTAPINAQVQHEHIASQDRSLHFGNNHGTPGVAAVSHPMNMQNHNQLMHSGVPAHDAAPAGRPEGEHMGQGGMTGMRPMQDNTPQNRPTPQPQSRPQPENRPTPQPQSRPTPAPQSRPAPAPQSHPAPQAHPAPQSHPAPAPQSHSDHKDEHSH